MVDGRDIVKELDDSGCGLQGNDCQYSGAQGIGVAGPSGYLFVKEEMFQRIVRPSRCKPLPYAFYHGALLNLHLFRYTGLEMLPFY
jgi:hypothetical protein